MIVKFQFENSLRTQSVTIKKKGGSKIIGPRTTRIRIDNRSESQLHHKRKSSIITEMKIQTLDKTLKFVMLVH